MGVPYNYSLVLCTQRQHSSPAFLPLSHAQTSLLECLGPWTPLYACSPIGQSVAMLGNGRDASSKYFSKSAALPTDVLRPLVDMKVVESVMETHQERT